LHEFFYVILLLRTDEVPENSLKIVFLVSVNYMTFTRVTRNRMTLWKITPS